MSSGDATNGIVPLAPASAARIQLAPGAVVSAIVRRAAAAAVLLPALACVAGGSDVDAGPADVAGEAEATSDAGDAGPDRACGPARLGIRPVLYLPSDASLSAAEEGRAVDLLARHLELGRTHFSELLVADTFCVEQPIVHRSPRTATEYQAAASPDSAHLMAASLLEAAGQDRNGSRDVFVAVFVRPPDLPCGGERPCLGGGRTFNGYPGTGGGIVQLEITSLLADVPYPFQSTLVHELGHAFGLVHSDCYGEDLALGRSIMSYNPEHWSVGLERSATPGTLLPEEYFLLDGNALAFPSFGYEAAVHNPTGRPLVGIDGTCELAPMDASLGPLARAGYELFFDGVRVSGPDAQFYTRGQARESCAWNVANQPAGIAILCLFDGARIGGR